VVPATVPQRGPDGTFAYVIQQDQTVQPRPIEIDATEGNLAVVSKGLAEGEQVVADGQSQLRAGSKVIPRQAGAPSPPAREGELQRGAASQKEGPKADAPHQQARGSRQ